MNKWLAALAVLFCLLRPCRAELELVGGPPRSFGGRSVTRTFHIDAEGPVRIEWRNRVLRGIIERGSLQADGPGDVAIELNLPEVRARIEMVQEVLVKQGDKVVASGTFPLDLFPTGLAAPAETPGPIVGVIDDAGALAAFLEEAGWAVVRLTTNLQYAQVESKVVLVAPEQPETIAEPMSGLDEFVAGGGTAIFLAQSEARKNLFDAERAWSISPAGAASAEVVVKADHSALLDLKPADLSNWAGSGRVAERALAWDDWPWRRAWLVSRGPEPRALLAEYWDGKGRVIRCQMDIGAHLQTEPVAQILLRNLLYRAQLPPPPGARVVRYAVQRPSEDSKRRDGNTLNLTRDPKPEELKTCMAVIAVVVSGDRDETAGTGLRHWLETGCPVVIQSAFDDDATEMMNIFTAFMWTLEGRKELRLFVGKPAPDDPIEALDYGCGLLCGLNAQILGEAIEGAAGLQIVSLAEEDKRFRALTQPGILSEYRRGKMHLVFCALPLDDPDNEARKAVVNQILANLSDSPKKGKEPNVE